MSGTALAGRLDSALAGAHAEKHTRPMSTLAEVEAALPRLTAAELAEVERLARITRLGKEQSHATRPKVGETMDPPCHIPDAVFAPLTAEELKAWGL